MNSADRLSLERQLQVPLRRALPSQGRTTVGSDHDTDILDMKGAAELLHFGHECAVGRDRAEIADDRLHHERGDQAKHRANLVQAIRDSKTKLYCPVSLGLRTNVAITLGVRSFRERKVYGWNAGEQKAVAF